MTPKEAVLAYCSECLLLDFQRARFDCLNPVCALYAAMPWRGRELPRRMDVAPGNPWLDSYIQDLRDEAAKVPRGRATAAMIRAKCRDCQPGSHQDCGCPECPLHEFHPYQPGGPKKAALSPKQLAARRAGLAKANRMRSLASQPLPEEPTSTAPLPDREKPQIAKRTPGMAAAKHKRNAGQITGPSPAARADAVAPAAKGDGPDSWSVEQGAGASPGAAQSG